MGATIEGKGRVFAKDHGEWISYTLGISSKNQDDKWVNAYQPIRFKSGVKVESGTDIEYRAFPVVKERIVDGQNRNYIVWQILEFKIAGDDMAQPQPEEVEGFKQLTNDDCPF